MDGEEKRQRNFKRNIRAHSIAAFRMRRARRRQRSVLVGGVRRKRVADPFHGRFRDRQRAHRPRLGPESADETLEIFAADHLQIRSRQPQAVTTVALVLRNTSTSRSERPCSIRRRTRSPRNHLPARPPGGANVPVPPRVVGFGVCGLRFARQMDDAALFRSTGYRIGQRSSQQCLRWGECYVE